ncbi:hypothetical protein [Streptomyces sp. B6B3]|uniref:hypothetical protein n=1 Tax=Streptomyces sp. B6B3 TaxID=3153570 RepID=UPI00325D69AD
MSDATVSNAPPAQSPSLPGRGWIVAALWATPPLLFFALMHVYGAEMATASGDEDYEAALDRVMPWVEWSGLGSLAVALVLCALLPDFDDGRRVLRRPLAVLQFVLLLLPTVLIRNLPLPS